jgi:hypothetical protein
MGYSCQGYRARFQLQRVRCECDGTGARGRYGRPQEGRENTEQRSFVVRTVHAAVDCVAGVASLTVPTKERRRLIALDDTQEPRPKSVGRR